MTPADLDRIEFHADYDAPAAPEDARALCAALREAWTDLAAERARFKGIAKERDEAVSLAASRKGTTALIPLGEHDNMENPPPCGCAVTINDLREQRDGAERIVFAVAREMGVTIPDGLLYSAGTRLLLTAIRAPRDEGPRDDAPQANHVWDTFAGVTVCVRCDAVLAHPAPHPTCPAAPRAPDCPHEYDDGCPRCRGQETP